MTDDDVAVLGRQLREAMAGGAFRLLTPLPRKVRLRLWYRRRVDGVAIWFVDRGCLRAAERVWRVFGTWR